MEPEEEEVGRPLGVDDAGCEPLTEEIERGLAQQVVLGRELTAERGYDPLPVPLQTRQGAPDPTAGDLSAQVIGGDVLEMVGLVEDDALVRREDRRFLPVVRRLAHREVGREQMVIDHHHVGLSGLPTRRKEETPGVERALEARAEIGLGAHLVPHFRRGGHGQVG